MQKVYTSSATKNRSSIWILCSVSNQFNFSFDDDQNAVALHNSISFYVERSKEIATYIKSITQICYSGFRL